MRAVLLSVPPEIVPFPPAGAFEEGQRTRLLCGLARADPPVTFRWLKDGVRIAHAHGSSSSSDGTSTTNLLNRGSEDDDDDQLVKITTNVADFSSLLTFVSLRSESHSGNYTCVAENAAGKAEYTALISVKGTIMRNAVTGSRTWRGAGVNANAI